MPRFYVNGQTPFNPHKSLSILWHSSKRKRPSLFGLRPSIHGWRQESGRVFHLCKLRRHTGSTLKHPDRCRIIGAIPHCWGLAHLRSPGRNGTRGPTYSNSQRVGDPNHNAFSNPRDSYTDLDPTGYIYSFGLYRPGRR